VEEVTKEKASWDARKEFAKLLLNKIDYINYCIEIEDIRSSCIAIQNLIGLVRRTIGIDNENRLRKNVRNVREVYNIKQNSGGLNEELAGEYYEIDKLHDIVGELIYLISDLLLPFKQDDDISSADDLKQYLKERLRKS